MLSRKSPAKINLALHIVGQREDGYHLLDSLVCLTDFGDQISVFVESKLSLPVTLEKSGPFAIALCNDERNLIFRAAHMLRDNLSALGNDCPPVVIHLEKNLPVASGIGGGSSNAATTLILLKELWAKEQHFDLVPIAELLGADVAMCLDNQPKRVGGIGNIIAPFAMAISLPMVLVNCRQEVATPAVFSELKNKTNAPIIFDNATLKGIRQIGDILEIQRNDLTKPAVGLCPRISDVLQILAEQNDCLLSRMTGSGGACFGIFPTTGSAQTAARNILETHPQWWAVATHSLKSTE